MELPPYRMPTLRGVLIHTWERTWEYAKKAGTIILGISILIWAMMTFPQLPEERTAAYETRRATIVAQLDALGEDADEDTVAAIEEQLAAVDNAEAEEAIHHTVAGRIGTALEPVSQLAGFDWRTNIALTGGFAAKEVIVSTLGTAYSLGEVDPEDTETLAQKLVNDPMFTPASAVALILFTMLYAPCFVTVVAMARESSWTWAAYSVTGSTVLAFGMAVAGYNLARLLL
jgi:ferrous iron transport protein B